MTQGRLQADQAKAMLALHLGNHRDLDPGPAVTDEELALMAEERLPFPRRQQVIRQLLDDEALFRRWLNLMEAVRGLAIESGAETRRMRGPAFGSLLQWLMSGAVATAALVLGIYIGNQQPGQDASPANALAGGELVRQTPLVPGEKAARAEVLPSPLDNLLCTGLSHPGSGIAGQFCLVNERIPEQKAPWIHEGFWLSASHGNGQREMRMLRVAVAEPGDALALRASSESRWLALLRREGDTFVIYVGDSGEWFEAGTVRPPAPVRIPDSGKPIPALHWQGTSLEVITHPGHDASSVIRVSRNENGNWVATPVKH